MAKRLTTEEFIDKARKVHGDKYSYDRVVYVKSNAKVEIYCNKHHKYWQQSPNAHLQGHGCKLCANEFLSDSKTRSRYEFIEIANKIHNSYYGYDEVVYVNSRTHVKIYCPDHDGYFYQECASHLQGHKCGVCHNSVNSTTEEFIKKSIKVHGDKFLYDRVNYIDLHHTVDIGCKEHGYSPQFPGNHLKGYGCLMCSGNYRRTTAEFIDRAIKRHGDTYVYDKVNYVSCKQPVEIICRKHGGYLLSPDTHINGSGCPLCSATRGENLVMDFLNKHNIEYRYQYPLFKMRCDFYLPAYNTIIEYNGKQHYKPIDFFGGIKTLLAQAKRDTIKKHYCLNSGIRFITIPYWNIDSISSILSHRLNIKTQIP